MRPAGGEIAALGRQVERAELIGAMQDVPGDDRQVGVRRVVRSAGGARGEHGEGDQSERAAPHQPSASPGLTGSTFSPQRAQTGSLPATRPIQPHSGQRPS